MSYLIRVCNFLTCMHFKNNDVISYGDKVRLFYVALYNID